MSIFLYRFQYILVKKKYTIILAVSVKKTKIIVYAHTAEHGNHRKIIAGWNSSRLIFYKKV